MAGSPGAGRTTLSSATMSPTSPLATRLHNQMILAPLTRGGNLPFRRLCADFGCEVAMGEMVFARSLIKGDKVEMARLRRAANERLFGVQIATNGVEEGVRAATLAADAGADWVDLNCGCPIYEATRRNLGSALLRYPHKLGKLVAGIAAGSRLPLSVKVRIAPEGGDINVREVVAALRDAGAAAVTIHGRTTEARYSKAADWELIAQCVSDNADYTMPIVGNGDILTHFEARRHIEQSGVDSVMGTHPTRANIWPIPNAPLMITLRSMCAQWDAARSPSPGSSKSLRAVRAGSPPRPSASSCTAAWRAT